MSAINELKEILEQTVTAEFVTTMLRDISATKLQAIRGEFEANQKYFAELHDIMALVQAYAKEVRVRIADEDRNRRVYVAVTSNKRFYGNLNHEIIRSLYAALLSNPEAACVIVGQTGEQIGRLQRFPTKPEFVSFAKDEPTEAELYALIEKLETYDEVLVVHPTFINSFQQHAKTTDITHLPKRDSRRAVKAINYLLEPDIPKIISFFKTQIRLTLFMRVLLETQVAFTGARLMKMQRAREKAGEQVKQQRYRIHKEESTVKNMRLLETFTGFNTHKL